MSQIQAPDDDLAPGQLRSGDSEDGREKVVDVDNLGSFALQPPCHAGDKRGDGWTRERSARLKMLRLKAQVANLVLQRAGIVQHRNPKIVPTAQRTKQLHRLSFGAAKVKGVRQLHD